MQLHASIYKEKCVHEEKHGNRNMEQNHVKKPRVVNQFKNVKNALMNNYIYSIYQYFLRKAPK